MKQNIFDVKKNGKNKKKKSNWTEQVKLKSLNLKNINFIGR